MPAAARSVVLLYLDRAEAVALRLDATIRQGKIALVVLRVGGGGGRSWPASHLRIGGPPGGGTRSWGRSCQE